MTNTFGIIDRKAVKGDKSDLPFIMDKKYIDSLEILCGRFDDIVVKFIPSDDYIEFCQDTDINTLIVDSPISKRYEICKLGLENNKNIICENPPACTHKQVSELKQIAADKNLSFIVNYSFLWDHEYLMLKNGFNFLPDQADIFIESTFSDPSISPGETFWRFGSLATSMLLDLLGQKYPQQSFLDFFSRYSLKNQYLLRVVYPSCLGFLTFGNLSNAQSNKITLQIKDQTLEYQDDFSNSSTKRMLEDFILKIEKKQRYENFDLVLATTLYLEQLEKENITYKK